MKQLLLLLLILVLLAGCDLRNRQDSENFIPTGPFDVGESKTYVRPGADPVLPGEKSVVKTVQTYTGEVPLSSPVRSYSYQLPMIDLSGAHAAGCNRDIENYFGSMIQVSLEAMKRYEDPLLERLSYKYYTLDGILTLRIDCRNYDGTESQAWYTVDVETGEAVSVSRLFAVSGISEDPKTLIVAAAKELFGKRYGTVSGQESDPSYSTALFRTTEALQLLTANRMHLNENGNLIVAIELFAPNGGSTMEELTLP